MTLNAHVYTKLQYDLENVDNPAKLNPMPYNPLWEISYITIL